MTPYWSNGISSLYHADALALPIPDKSVHCVVTSPPYWGQRDYDLSEWHGGNAHCHHILNYMPDSMSANGETMEYEPGDLPSVGMCLRCSAIYRPVGIGQEPTLDDWISNIVAVSQEVWRVLRDDGTYWINIGDAYARSGGLPGGKPGNIQWNNSGSRVRRKRKYPRPDKNLLGQPWQVAFALQNDGWVLRSAIVWQKANPIPDGAYDRPSTSYEMIFLLSKTNSMLYWRHEDGKVSYHQPEPDWVWRHVKTGELALSNPRYGDEWKRLNRWQSYSYFYDNYAVRDHSSGDAGANMRDVWTFAKDNNSESHRAAFPEALPRRCIMLSTSEYGVCGDCGSPWRRVLEVDDSTGNMDSLKLGIDDVDDALTSYHMNSDAVRENAIPKYITSGWHPGCECNAERIPATVLDPFVGSGTTLVSASQLGRRGIGVDLNNEYLNIAQRRLQRMTLPLGI